MFSAIKQAIFILFCAILLAGGVNLLRPDGIDWLRQSKTISGTASKADVATTRISIETAFEAFQTKRAVFLDARNPEIYDEAHIPGAINIPPEQFEVDAEPFINRVPPNQEVILYCDGPGCHLAETLAELMLEVGYEKLTLFTDGWQGWSEKELPIASGKEDAS